MSQVASDAVFRPGPSDRMPKVFAIVGGASLILALGSPRSAAADSPQPKGQVIFASTPDAKTGAVSFAPGQTAYAVAQFANPISSYATNFANSDMLSFGQRGVSWVVFDLGAPAPKPVFGSVPQGAILNQEICRVPVRTTEIGGKPVYIDGAQRHITLSLIPSAADFDARLARTREELACTTALKALPKKQQRLRVVLAAHDVDVLEKDVLAEGTVTIDLSGDALDKQVAALQCRANGTRTLPPAGRRDTSLEKDVAKLMADFARAKTVKVSVIEPDWNVVRHSVTGAVIQRHIQVFVGTAESDGSCRLRDAHVFQESVGGKFGATKLPPRSGIGNEIICCDKLK